VKKKISLIVSLKKHLPIAIEHHKKGDLSQAEPIYRSLYKKYPKNVDLLHFYGRLLFETNDKERGITLVRQAVKYDPMYADALNNLGNMYNSRREYSKAKNHYERALAANPRFYDAMINLGSISKNTSKMEDAELWYRKALESNPTKFTAYNSLVGLLRVLRRYDEAFHILDEALAKITKNAEYEQGLFSQKSRLHYMLNQPEQAIDTYRAWLEKYPDNAVAKHMVASLSGENYLEKPDNDYVKGLFDKFSSSFDDVLEGLDYKAPQLTGDIVQRHFTTHQNNVNGTVVLDAGCGTGLCAKYLKPVSSTLIGVDLSAGMLAHAQSLNLYDSLIEAEIEDYLSDNTNAFDLIVSADTFCYFGALESLFSACSASLSPKGMLGFTLEVLAQDSNSVFNEGYFLNPHGRYSHSQSYVVEALEAVGFHIREIEHATLRKESGKGVEGIIVLAESFASA
jgi:predicted TPR repeat methyltransferase